MLLLPLPSWSRTDQPSHLLCADQLKDVLLWWAGGVADGANSGGGPPHIEGQAGILSCAPKDKTARVQAVLQKAEPSKTYTIHSSNWQGLRRTMPYAAAALLEELGGQGDGQAPALASG